MKSYEDGDRLKISRIKFFRCMENETYNLDEHYVVAEKSKGIKAYFDSRKLGFFDDKKILRMLKGVGFRKTALINDASVGVFEKRNRYVAVK